MTRQEVFWQYQNEIIEVYKEFNLTSLRGLNSEFQVNGRQILSWYFNVVRKGRIKFQKGLEFDKLFDDLLFCSDEILFFLANMYLYQLFINNPISDGFIWNGKMLYPNYQNMEAKMYSMFANAVSEKLYNYWDRIGDLISFYFPDLIKPEKVFFVTAIDIIPSEYHSSPNYLWLRKFKDENFIDLNSKRKQTVHYISEDTKFKYNHLSSSTNQEEIERIYFERIALADYYKKHLEFTIEGFEKTILLVEEITEETISDVEIDSILAAANKPAAVKPGQVIQSKRKKKE